MYREDAPTPALRELVQCTWVHRGHASVSIVPDACVDLIWDGRSLWVAGPDTHAVREEVHGVLHGIRVRTGCAAAVLGVPASALRDARVELAALWEVGPYLEALQREPCSQVLQRMVALRRPTDSMVEALVARLRVDPAQRVAKLARELGVSERQLNRRCTTAVGYGPKLLARILRMQNIQRALRRQGAQGGLADLAARFGFADQAHLAHEASELYGLTPSQLRAG